MQAIEQRLDEIDAMTRVWPDELKARAGAVVYLSHQGTAEIERGLIRSEDADQHDDKEEQHEAKDADATPERSPYPASLIEDLTAQKTAALRIETARSPGIALALAVHALAMDVFYGHGDAVLKLRLTQRGLQPAIREHESCPAAVGAGSRAGAHRRHASRGRGRFVVVVPQRRTGRVARRSGGRGGVRHRRRRDASPTLTGAAKNRATRLPPRLI